MLWSLEIGIPILLAGSRFRRVTTAPDGRRISINVEVLGGNTKADRTNKKAEVIAMMKRAKGATLAEIMKATGWQAHSVRGFLSGTLGKKMGLALESTKREDGERQYRIGRSLTAL